ncbi:hypothetical protein ACROYT_G010049 [Oculina patagonica]
MSGGQQVHEGCVTKDEETVGETNLHVVVEETPGNDDQETELEQTGDEEQPLIIVVNDPHANRTTTGHTGCSAIRRIITFLAKIFGKIAVGCGYVILIIAALPKNDKIRRIMAHVALERNDAERPENVGEEDGNSGDESVDECVRVMMMMRLTVKRRFLSILLVVLVLELAGYLYRICAT